jgi:hypothetical protein
VACADLLVEISGTIPILLSGNPAAETTSYRAISGRIPDSPIQCLDSSIARDFFLPDLELEEVASSVCSHGTDVAQHADRLR